VPLRIREEVQEVLRRTHQLTGGKRHTALEVTAVAFAPVVSFDDASSGLFWVRQPLPSQKLLVVPAVEKDHVSVLP